MYSLQLQKVTEIKKKTNINNITIHSYLANRNYEQELTKITLTGKRAVNCSLIETKDNTLHAIGFYSNLKKKWKGKNNCRRNL